MDADTTLLTPELHCDGCGYSRRGLDPAARCPECGEAAPRAFTVDDGPTLQSLFDDPLRSPADLLWLRMTAIGLVVLLAFWLDALRVALVMPIGSFALGAMNFAGPKLNLAATIQRSVGGQPGEWGITGCVAAFMQAVGIWLIASSRLAESRGEPMFSLRTVTRWSAVVAVGACLGLVLSNDGHTLLMPRSNQTGGLLTWAILLGELPANTLLYLYLLRLSRTLHNRRAVAIFRACAWIVPALAAGGALLVGIDIRRAKVPEPFWYVIAAVYGIAAVATAAAAVSGIALLLGTTAVAGFGRPFAASLVALRSLSRYLRTAAGIVNIGWARTAIIAGLLLWVSLLPTNLKAVLWAPTRTSQLGNLPSLNFLGPKVIAPLLNEDRYDRYYIGDQIFDVPVLPALAAIWLVTVPLPNRSSGDKMRRLARLLAVLAVGIPMGVRLAMWYDQADVSKLLAFGVTCCEVPATVLVYAYLARLASTVRGPTLTFVGVAVAVPVVAGLPVFGFVLSHLHKWQQHSAWTAVVSGLLASASLVVTLSASAAILQLAWKLAVSPAVARRPSAETASESAS